MLAFWSLWFLFQTLNTSSPSSSSSAASSLPWAPPAWHPDPESLLALESLYRGSPGGAPGGGGEDPPGAVKASSVFVFDLERHEIVYARNADRLQPVGSLTKVVTALTAAKLGLELEEVEEVGPLWEPARSEQETRSVLSQEGIYEGWDVLGASLVRDDHLGAYGQQIFTGLPLSDFVSEMHVVSRDLGMIDSSWDEPSGKGDENWSTAREMSAAILALASHPVLREVTSSRVWRLENYTGEKHQLLYSTNFLHPKFGLEIWGAKTGMTSREGYGYSGVIHASEKTTLVVTTLGSQRSQQRNHDLKFILRSMGIQHP